MISVAHQLPEFVREEYPGFVDFLKGYYDWREKEYSIGRLTELVDIDTTIESFLKYFRKELDIFQITNDQTSRFYLRHLKELYVSKGSRAAFEFLFKILFDKESKVKIPWDYVFIPSAAKWTVDFSIVTDLIEEDASLIVGKEITITDTSGNTHKVMVEYVNVLPNGRIELFVSRIAPHVEVASFSYHNNETEVTVAGLIEVRISSVYVVDAGSGFSVGQVFGINYLDGVGLTIRITGVDNSGGITAAEIISFGSGYNVPFTYPLSVGGGVSSNIVTFYPKITVILDDDAIYLRAAADGNLITADMDIVTADAGDLSFDFQTGDAVVYRNGGDGNTSIGGLTDGNIYYVIRVSSHKLKLAETVMDALTDNPIDLTAGATGSDHTLTLVGNAIVGFTVGTVSQYPGHYDDSFSVLGDGCFIQDSHYYQVYSYVTALEETVDKYATILKNVLHPSGTKHFAEYTILNEFEFTPTLELELDSGAP